MHGEGSQCMKKPSTLMFLCVLSVTANIYDKGAELKGLSFLLELDDKKLMQTFGIRIIRNYSVFK